MAATSPARLDLHSHSSRSDGVVAPAALYGQMAGAGMRLVALTDHDTLDGYRELRAAGAGPEPGPRPALVAGIEINAISGEDTWEGELHILGFGMVDEDADFEMALGRQRAGRAARIQETLDRLRALDMPVDDAFAEVIAGAEPSSLGRPHVARALAATGHAVSVDDAFARLLGRGRPAYVPRSGLGPRETIEAIRAAGGLPVLAHFREAIDRPELVDRLVDWGLGGLEVYYGGLGRYFNADEVAALAAFALGRRLVATGGTDYHGDTMPYAEAVAGLSVPTAVEEAFRSALEAARAERR
ncbi:MAG: PHP domain-containing protein [Candidatus Limnocylindrales bacterium]